MCLDICLYLLLFSSLPQSRDGHMLTASNNLAASSLVGSSKLSLTFFSPLPHLCRWHADLHDASLLFWGPVRGPPHLSPAAQQWELLFLFSSFFPANLLTLNETSEQNAVLPLPQDITHSRHVAPVARKHLDKHLLKWSSVFLAESLDLAIHLTQIRENLDSFSPKLKER